MVLFLSVASRDVYLEPEKYVEKVDGGIHRIPKITENKIQKMNTTALWKQRQAKLKIRVDFAFYLFR